MMHSGHVHTSRTQYHRCLLLGLILFTAAIHLGGFTRDLPYVPEADEPIYVVRAGQMAQTGDLNPHWFGNPGSTVIYPLAVFYRVLNIVQGQTVLFTDAAPVPWQYRLDHAAYYYVGRLLSIAYAVLSVPVLYLLGATVFSRKVGLAGALLFVVLPHAVFHAQITRTDSAGVFFTVLSLWLICRADEEPTILHYALVGIATGLAIATRYFMVTLFAALGIELLLRLIQQAEDRPSARHILGKGVVAGAASICVFAVTTPFFFLDFQGVYHSLLYEARDTHLGYDGLSWGQNLLWYVREAIPASLTLPVALFCLAGIGLSYFPGSMDDTRGHLRKQRTSQPLILAGFVVVYLLAISLSALHWQRWLIQILPVMTIFSAYAVFSIPDLVIDHLPRKPPRLLGRTLPALAAPLVLGLLIYSPLRQTTQQNIYLTGTSTRVVAYKWVQENVTPGSRIAQEWFTVPAAGLDVAVTEYPSLAEAFPALQSFREQGYDYIIAGSWIYDKYFAQEQRYVQESGFYRQLFGEYPLVGRFEPDDRTPGPTIQVFDIRLSGD